MPLCSAGRGWGGGGGGGGGGVGSEGFRALGWALRAVVFRAFRV